MAAKKAHRFRCAAACVGYCCLLYTSPEDASKMAGAIATQLLVWETVVGERDSQFNHVDTRIAVIPLQELKIRS